MPKVTCPLYQLLNLDTLTSEVVYAADIVGWPVDVEHDRFEGFGFELVGNTVVFALGRTHTSGIAATQPFVVVSASCKRVQGGLRCWWSHVHDACCFGLACLSCRVVSGALLQTLDLLTKQAISTKPINYPFYLDDASTAHTSSLFGIPGRYLTFVTGCTEYDIMFESCKPGKYNTVCCAASASATKFDRTWGTHHTPLMPCACAHSFVCIRQGIWALNVTDASNVEFIKLGEREDLLLFGATSLVVDNQGA